jgi:hypothetical protein
LEVGSESVYTEDLVFRFSQIKICVGVSFGPFKTDRTYSEAVRMHRESEVFPKRVLQWCCVVFERL